MSADGPVVGEVVEWGPGHPGFRPPAPYESGNEAALRHGAWSPRRVDPLAADVIAAVRPTLTWLTPADEPALQAWGRVEAQCQLIDAYLAAAGDVTEDGVGDLDTERVRAAYLAQHRFETRAATLRTQLGMTPLARARLGRDVAAAGASLAEQMAAEAARLAAEGGAS